MNKIAMLNKLRNKTNKKIVGINNIKVVIKVTTNMQSR